MTAKSLRSAVGPGAFAVETGRGLSLRANFAWTFVGNVVYAGCQWGILVVLAKVGTPETVGRFALALAVTAPVIMLTNLQLRGVQSTDARQDYRFGQYLALRLIMTAFAILAIAGIVVVSGYAAAVGLVILVVGIAKGFEAISDVVYGALQQHERMDRISLSMIIKGVVSLIALAFGVIVTGEVLWGVVALAVSWGAVMLFYDLPNAARVSSMSINGASGTTAEPASRYLKPDWDFSKLARLAWLSLPLGVVMLLISLNANVPRYFVEHFNGTRDLGIFAAMAYLMNASNTVIAALGQSASPRLSQYHADDKTAEFRSLLLKLLGMGALLGLVGIVVAILLGRQLLTLLYSPEYAAYQDVLVWIMVSIAFSNVASMFGYAATARRRIGFQPVAQVAILLASIITGFLLVPPLGLFGAALSMVVSSVVAMVAYALLSL